MRMTYLPPSIPKSPGCRYTRTETREETLNSPTFFMECLSRSLMMDVYARRERRDLQRRGFDRVAGSGSPFANDAGSRRYSAGRSFWSFAASQ